MNCKHLHALIAVMAGLLLAGCHSKIDFENIDKKVEVEGGLALPIGTMHATMGDFLGNGKVKKISVDEEGVFHYIDTVDIPTKEYHQINLANYILKNKETLEFKVLDHPVPNPIHGNGVDGFTFDFPMTIDMEGINDHTSDERIDSIWVTKAKFHSFINVKNFDLRWHEIKSVKLKLEDEFHRADGDIIDIPIGGHDFSDSIEINVDEFTLDLLKDKINHDPDQGTVNKINFTIIFEVVPDNNHTINLSANSVFTYDLKVDVIDYAAIWGFFEAGNQMRNTDTISLAKEWPEWKNVKKLKMRFAEPRIDVFVSHKVAAPLIMHIEYIKAIDSLGNPKPATWDGETSKDLYLKEYMSPLAETLQDSVLHHEFFNHEAGRGHIDELFDVRPDSFMYSFRLLVDQTKWKYNTDWRTWKQLRIVKDAKVYGYAVADVPFKFKEGSEGQYKDAIKNVNLSKVTLDSLLASENILDTVKASELKLIMVVKNRIPFDIYGQFTFLNADSVDMHLQLLQDNPTNRILFPAPKMERPAGQKYGYVSEASETTLIFNVKKSEFDRFAQVKHILFDASLSGNPQPCVLDTATDLSVKIGIAAKVDAIMDFNKK